MKFNNLGLREEILQAIDEVGYSEATPIQEKAIPEALEGHDLLCSAQTGTGKTAAFTLPILQRIELGERKNLQALILVPTRELAMQVGKNIREYSKHLDVTCATLFGGVDIAPQEMMLRHGADIVVATPGRLNDHLWRGNIDFRHTRFLVLDEADRMLDMGFIKDVKEIVSLIPKERQSMLFSATLDGEIRTLSKDILVDPVSIEVAPPTSTLDAVDQYLVRAERESKGSTLEALIRKHGMTRTIVFSRTKIGASRLASRLRQNGHRATAIHSDRSQGERTQALEGFRSGKIDILVATDVAARGIHVDDVSHVINFDLPRSGQDYVHRIGRTARAGRTGMAISLVTSEDARSVQSIERTISRKLAWMNASGTPVSSSGGETRTAVALEDAPKPSSTRRRRRPGGRGGGSRSKAVSRQSESRREDSRPSRPRSESRSDSSEGRSRADGSRRGGSRRNGSNGSGRNASAKSSPAAGDSSRSRGSSSRRSSSSRGSQRQDRAPVAAAARSSSGNESGDRVRQSDYSKSMVETIRDKRSGNGGGIVRSILDRLNPLR